MKAGTDLHILDIGHIIMQPPHIIVKIVAFCDIVAKITSRRLFPHNILERIEIFRLCPAKMDVLVERLLQFLNFLVASRKLHGRRQVADKAGRAPALRLNPLAHDRHPIRINVRQVA